MQVAGDNIVADFDKASTLERTVLMCMERIAELERRVDEAERANAEGRRAALINSIKSCFGYNTCFVDVMAWLIGVTPSMARALPISQRFGTINIDLLIEPSRGDIVASDRARELHVIARRGVDDGAFAWLPQFAPHFTPLPSCPDDDCYDVGAMLGAMTMAELEGYWAWRVEYVGWGRL